MSKLGTESWSERLPSKIRSLRHDYGLTQKEVAETIGVSEEALRSYETGHRRPKINTVRLLADAFDVDFEYLIAPSCINPLELFYSIYDAGDQAEFDMSITDGSLVLSPKNRDGLALLDEAKRIMRTLGSEKYDIGNKE